jgi:hypothetical protein
MSITIGGSTSTSDWYKDIIFYLKLGQFPNGMSPKEMRTLKMKSTQYVLIAQILFRRNFVGILLRCVDDMKAQELIK